ncbi:shufflon system plasmid conjugative transfer pilus tip adhesin PilV [Photorhabdus luminescens]|uniref:shufflon system plasmid conjugative transfer pilus tip adhesin PilV n=1 Tax=Photorhabdus luminescens TaxID=29488 RepID=UPI001595A1D5|nr:shufflon system plasmid conjugative transfer pilus tip adhesin PilV [Photorhabdus luminescens]
MTERNGCNDSEPDRGYMMLGTAAGLMILLILAALGTRIYNDYLTEKSWQVMAAQSSRFSAASKAYIGRYYDRLRNSATTTQPVMITPDMLRKTGLLPSGFKDTNSSGQHYQTAVVRNTQDPALLQAIVVTQEGSPLPYKALRLISMDISTGLGGYIRDGKTATGAMSSWTVPLKDFGINSGEGHLAVLLSADELSTAREESDRLYRFAVPGRPELNKMHTDINMGGNNLNNTATVNAQAGHFSGDIRANAGQFQGDIRSHDGWIVTTKNKGWLNETYGGGWMMSDSNWLRSVNNKSVYTEGQIKSGTLRADGRLSTGEFLQLDKVVVAGTPCLPNGLVSRDSKGTILSCQSGLWTKAEATLQQNQCYQDGNWGGRDFSEHRCKPGYYAAGLKFVGHQRSESAYVITCCK